MRQGRQELHTMLVEQRMAAGEEEYRGRSYSKSPMDLIDEMQQELLDVEGWGQILETVLNRYACRYGVNFDDMLDMVNDVRLVSFELWGVLEDAKESIDGNSDEH